MIKIAFFAVAFFALVSFSNKPITWVAIGDSITYLNDHTNETGNRVTKGYMTRVTEKLANIQFVNRGFNGWTSGGIAVYLRCILRVSRNENSNRPRRPWLGPAGATKSRNTGAVGAPPVDRRDV